jgi:hypothetical protein
VWPNDASTFVVQRPVRTPLVTFAFRYPDSKPRTVTLISGSQQAVIALDNSIQSLAVRSPPDDDGKVIVQIEPPGSVVVSRQQNIPESNAVWRPARNRALLPNRSSRNGKLAEASVTEADLLGVRTFGVPIRSGPHTTDNQIAMATHGDRLEATCWTEGDTITTDLFPRPLDLPIYTSDIWFNVQLPDSQSGYIPDVRFSRTDRTGRLNLPQCSADKGDEPRS